MMHSLYLVLAGSLVWASLGLHVGNNDKDQGPLDGPPPIMKILVARHGYTCGDAFSEFSGYKQQALASKYSITQRLTGQVNPKGKNDVLTRIGAQEMEKWTEIGAHVQEEQDVRQDVKIVFSSGLETAIESAAIMFPNALIMPIPYLGNVSFESDPAVGEAVHERLGSKGQMFKVDYRWDRMLKGNAANSWEEFLGFLKTMYLPNAVDFEDGSTIGVMTHADIMKQPAFASCKKTAYHDHKGELQTQGWTPKANSMVLLNYEVTNKAVENSFDVTPEYMLTLQKEFQSTNVGTLSPSCSIVHSGFSLKEKLATSLRPITLCEADFVGCPQGMDKPPTVESQRRESAGLVSDLEQKMAMEEADHKKFKEAEEAAVGWKDLSKKQTALNLFGWASNKVIGRSPLRTKEDQVRRLAASEAHLAAFKHERKAAQRAKDSLTASMRDDGTCYVAGNRPQEEEEAIIEPADGADSDVVAGMNSAEIDAQEAAEAMAASLP